MAIESSTKQLGLLGGMGDTGTAGTPSIRQPFDKAKVEIRQVKAAFVPIFKLSDAQAISPALRPVSALSRVEDSIGVIIIRK